MEDGQADMAKVSDNEMEFWRNYSLAALEKWREIERSVTRTSGLMVLVAAVFELINRKSVAEVTLPFVKLTNPGLVQISLPVVIAYLYSNLTELSSEADWTSRAYELSFKRVRPIDPGEFYLWALTPAATIITPVMRLDKQRELRAERLAYVGAGIRAILFFLWPIAFEVYAYAILFAQQGSFRIWVIISSIISTLLFLFSFAALFAAPSDPPTSE